jgi:hypothetical protein
MRLWQAGSRQYPCHTLGTARAIKRTSDPRLVTARLLHGEDRLMTVWIYVDTSKQVGDPNHLKVFANQDAAEAWFAENDPEGVAFEYEVMR